jgi:hypothetical protein
VRLELLMARGQVELWRAVESGLLLLQLLLQVDPRTLWSRAACIEPSFTQVVLRCAVLVT